MYEIRRNRSFRVPNCDHDTYNVIESIAHQPVTFLWHDSADLEGVDAIAGAGWLCLWRLLLRTGAIARFSPVMESVKKFAAGGAELVLGIQQRVPDPRLRLVACQAR